MERLYLDDIATRVNSFKIRRASPTNVVGRNQADVGSEQQPFQIVSGLKQADDIAAKRGCTLLSSLSAAQWTGPNGA
jgi:hypothetical protein